MNKAQQIFAEYKAELIKVEGSVLVVSAKEIPTTERRLIREELGIAVEQWLVGLKPSTYELMIKELNNPMLQVSTKEEGFKELRVKLTTRGQAELDSDVNLAAIWETVCKHLINDGYYIKWTMEPGNWKYDPAIVKELSTHKERDRAISAEDVTDVLILVESAKTVDEFINSLN